MPRKCDGTALARLGPGEASRRGRPCPIAPDERREILLSAAEHVFTDLGYAEARIEDSKVRQEAEASSLEIARNTLLGVDPFDVATRLTDAQQRLESLYAVTARLSRLTLSDFLR